MPDLQAATLVSSCAAKSEPLRHLLSNWPSFFGPFGRMFTSPLSVTRLSALPLLPVSSRPDSPNCLPRTLIRSPFTLRSLVCCSLRSPGRPAKVAPTRRGGKVALRSAAATVSQRRADDHPQSRPGQSKSFRHTFSKTASSLLSLVRRSQPASDQQALIQSPEGGVSRQRRHDRGTRPDRARSGYAAPTQSRPLNNGDWLRRRLSCLANVPCQPVPVPVVQQAVRPDPQPPFRPPRALITHHFQLPPEDSRRTPDNPHSF